MANEYLNEALKSMDFDNADVVGAKPNVLGGSIAQFDLKIDRIFHSGGVGAPTDPSDQFPVILFGASDHESFFTETMKKVQLPTGWLYDGCYCTPDQSLLALIGGWYVGQNGELIFVFVNPGSGSPSWLITRVRCQNVAYLNLLKATISDRFKAQKMIYALPNPANVAQFDNKIDIVKTSLFGKSTVDSINPNSYKTENAQRPEILTVPLNLTINKESSWVIPVNQGQSFALSVFVNASEKTI
jgi:hypothetical protein